MSSQVRHTDEGRSISPYIHIFIHIHIHIHIHIECKMEWGGMKQDDTTVRGGRGGGGSCVRFMDCIGPGSFYITTKISHTHTITPSVTLSLSFAITFDLIQSHPLLPSLSPLLLPLISHNHTLCYPLSLLCYYL